MIREITIGRDLSCDIRLDNSCTLASRLHATIYLDGNQLMYCDKSSNGTLINNIAVRRRAVPVRRGDSIMVAGRYPISWNVIERALQGMAYQRGPEPAYTTREYDVNAFAQPQQPATPARLHDWNWGAFLLYPFWGFGNGCWWAFFIGFFGGWLWPIPNIIFGVFGSRWSWENKRWSSIAAFDKAQHDWMVWGLIIFAINIFLIILCWSFFVAALASIANL